MIEAIPLLTGVVLEGGSSGSEAEGADDDDNGDDDAKGTKSINPAHVRHIDTGCKVLFCSSFLACYNLNGDVV